MDQDIKVEAVEEVLANAPKVEEIAIVDEPEPIITEPMDQPVKAEDMRGIESNDAEETDSQETESDSSSDSSDSEPEHTALPRREENFDEEDEDTGIAKGEALKTQHEIVDPIVTLLEITKIDDSEPIDVVGTVLSIIDSVVIVQGLPRKTELLAGSDRVLDSESLLVTEDRSVIGQVFETFGPTVNPMYSVRFPSAESITERNITVGQKVYHSPQRSNFAFPGILARLRGSDASNVYDEEPDSDEMEYSDDEQERAAKQKNRSQRGRGAAPRSTPSRYETSEETPILSYGGDDPYAENAGDLTPTGQASVGFDPYDMPPSGAESSSAVSSGISPLPGGLPPRPRMRGTGRGRGRGRGMRRQNEARPDMRQPQQGESWQGLPIPANAPPYAMDQQSFVPTDNAAPTSFVQPHINPLFANAFAFNPGFMPPFFGNPAFNGQPQFQQGYWNPSWNPPDNSQWKQ